MSAVCDFYIECSERGIFPLEASAVRPSGVQLKTIYVKNRDGSRMRVTGISVREAIKWINKRDIPVPVGMIDFLECFADCDRCDGCGCVDRSDHFFFNPEFAERFCSECA